MVETPQKLTRDNYNAGFLVDEELMAGISENADRPGVYTAFVVRHTTGEMLGVQYFENLFEAIRTINDIPRSWSFEPVKKCGSGNCGSGKCGSGGCGMKSARASADTSCESGVECQK